MASLELDPVDRIVLAEIPDEVSTVSIWDAPALVEPLVERGAAVRVFCDDLRAAEAVPAEYLVEHPDEMGDAALAVARLPKSLGALDEMAVSSLGDPNLLFVAGGRDKHMSRSMNSVLEKYFTGVNASLGRQKSRALRGYGPVDTWENAWPKLKTHEEWGITTAAHGHTFGGAKIDPGTKLLLGALGDLGEGRVLDFGCGNGSIALTLARRGANVTGVDVSWAAVAATQIGAAETGIEVETFWADGTTELPSGSFDVIVTNPPFHRGTAKDSAATLALFDDARRLLRPGGELWCVYNSHLPWRKELNLRLGRTRVVAQNPQYTVAQCVA